MRPLRFLLPGTTGKFRCGGLQVELQSIRLTAGLRPTELVTYRQREAGRPFLDDLLRDESAPGAALWIVSWGFDVPRLLRRLRGRPVAYHAHSSGYGFDLPHGVPVLAVSRNTLGYWGDRASRNPLFLVPNALEPQWRDQGLERDIDVLVQARKTSAYVLHQLVPALRSRGLRVEVQQGWVDDLVGLFNRARVYLYDSADYWRGRGVTEGFGLPPLEAMACGCVVFSSLNHALADLIDPGSVGHQIGSGTLPADLERIEAAAADPASWRADPAQLALRLTESCETRLQERWQGALEEIDGHWDRLQRNDAPAGASPALEALRSPRLWQLRWRQWLARLRRLLLS
ncbi:glycosyltransferase [Synechococcus sp. BSF8S]|uniref:glycosyltransferase n=1 Tax=Synechococcales TaxID=1890424 RepID=UPI001628866C|nr:glycosyltransferase [Synechococcus sp. BSF8S]MBC1264856.1 glycosyltransferase [Synechococcus sp. BSA11S]